MRRALALLLAMPFTALASAGSAPAAGADPTYVVVRALESNLDLFDRPAYGCDGDSTGGYGGLELKVSSIHLRGQASLLVKGAPDFQRGLLLRSPADPAAVSWPVYPLTGEAPAARWWVEMNDDVLTSDPIPLVRDTWNDLRLSDVTLSDGAGWSGTIDDYLAEFGTGSTWGVGLFTGGCLGSREVRIDAIGTPSATYDFEPRDWVTLTATPADRRHRDQIRLTARAHHYDLASDSSARVAGARLVFQRRWPSASQWRTVATQKTNQRGTAVVTSAAGRAADWRAVWRRPGKTIPSDPVHQR